jgi:2-oxoglutarate ferredoxin oxidoreductase subunit gamma
MANRTDLRFSGSGGQGMILGAIIMAEAACIFGDMNACQSQSYGPEARGGSSKSDVIISDGAIHYPKATKLNVLLAMTQESVDKYAPELAPGGVLVVDDEYVDEIPDIDAKIVRIPIMKLAVEAVGKAVVANIVALGILQRLTGLVSEKSLKEAILSRVPKGTEHINMKALETGFEAAKPFM